MLIRRNGDEELCGSSPIKRTGEYDNCSEDSCWVQQYLEWCDPKIAVANRAGLEVGAVAML